MGNNYSIKNEEIYIHSPKNNCPIKPFPILKSKPIPIKQKKEKEIKSNSLPCSFELKIINQEEINGNEKSRTMGRQIQTNQIEGYDFTSTYFKNYSNNDR